MRRSVLPVVPSDYPDRVRGVRVAIGCSQAQFAARLGAANKAVIIGRKVPIFGTSGADE